MALNSNIKGSFKKFLLLFCQAEMVFVIIWFFDQFSLKPVPSMNGVLAPNNVIWVSFSAILFDDIRHVVQRSTPGHVPVSYEIINHFIEPHNFLLMFFIYKLKGYYLLVTVRDGLLVLSLDFINSCIPPTWYVRPSEVLYPCLFEILQ